MPAALRVLAEAHDGIVTRQQAIAGGMTRSAIQARLVSRRWQQVYRGVYAIFSGPLDRRARLWAVILYVGKGAVFSHDTAAELQNLTDERHPLIHVTVPYERRVRVVPGLAVHRSERLARYDLRFPEGELPRTGTEETILDLAASMDDVDEVCALMTRAFARSRTSVEFMRFALAQRDRQKWRVEIDEFVTAAAGGAHSVLEFRYDRDVEKAHGLPPSRHQVPFRKEKGTRGYRDRVYEDYKLIIELDGEQAHPSDKRWEDKARDNAAAADGNQSLRYGWKDVRRNSCETALQIVKVLWARGWQGGPKPCSPRCPLKRLAVPAAQGA